MGKGKGVPDNKARRELLRGLPDGFRLERRGGNSHLLVIRPNGEPLRDDRGLPIRISSTGGKPADDLARVRRAIG